MEARNDSSSTLTVESTGREDLSPGEVFGEGDRFERFSLNERLQHIVLFSSFIVLVFTGFPLKYPEVDFLDPLFYLTGGVRGARIIHRTAAVIMGLDFLYHNLYIFSLLYRRRIGLKEILLMVPQPKDVKDLVQNFRYFMGLSKERPRFGKFSYLEKFDYWAVYWGIFIMGGSGLVLWFPEFWTQFTPIDIVRIAYIAHSDEALLAFLAITCWHLYNVHLSPRHFPMNKVWYRGWLTREEMIEEHPLEYERMGQRTGNRTRKESS
jgi:formate dehydrogenase gamma subunit